MAVLFPENLNNTLAAGPLIDGSGSCVDPAASAPVKDLRGPTLRQVALC